MNIKTIALILAATILISGCVTTTLEPTEKSFVDFEVHFQNNFNEDDVLLRIDHNNIYAGSLTTDYTVSLAKIFRIQALSGTHKLYLNINNRHFTNTEFALDDSLYILIRFNNVRDGDLNPIDGIDLTITKLPPVYD